MMYEYRGLLGETVGFDHNPPTCSLDILHGQVEVREGPVLRRRDFMPPPAVLGEALGTFQFCSFLAWCEAQNVG